MAPELRKRKPAAEAPKAAPKQAKKPATNGKRKAAAEESPVSLKKQKPAKAAADSKTSAKESKPAKKTAAAKKEPVAEPEEVEEAEEEQNDDALVLATEMDSEDEEAAEGVTLFEEGQDVGKAPKASKEVVAAAQSGDGESGVVYIGRIPHGFYEHEMRQYFSQFGPIKRLRLSRNKKTGASKHFAFVEFEEKSTAEIVCKTMDNYLLFGHILKCSVVPQGKVHEDLFKGANRRFKKVPWNKMAGKALEKPLTESAWQTKVEREKSKRDKKAEKLKAMGYDFEVPELKSVPPPAPVTAEPEEPKAIEEAPAAAAAAAAEETTEKAKAPKAKSPKATKAKKAKA